MKEIMEGQLSHYRQKLQRNLPINISVGTKLSLSAFIHFLKK